MKKLCLHDISIYTNFHQYRSINECARMIFAIKVVLYDLGLGLHLRSYFILQNICVFILLVFIKGFIKIGS